MNNHKNHQQLPHYTPLPTYEPPAAATNVPLESTIETTSTTATTTYPDINLNKAPHFIEKHLPCQATYKYSQLTEKAFQSSNHFVLQLTSAIFYAVTSFLIIVVNKIILTNYAFPSSHFLGIGQMTATLVVLGTAKLLNVITFPSYSRDLPSKVFPLPLFYAGNLIFGLVGTQRLSLPMFTVLRRFTILMTVIGEYIVLNIKQSSTVMATVVAMIGGAIVAAIDDLTFDSYGYFMVLSNDLCTAANGVYTKKKLDSKQLGKYGLLFYNSLFMLGPLIAITWIGDEFSQVWQYPNWFAFGFVVSFFSSCFMGFALMYSTILCTQYNSALTTTIIGCLKNILVTYIGMYVGGDYVFSFTNFLGLNISMLGSVVYSYVTFRGSGSGS